MKTIKYDPVDFMDDSEDMLAYLCEITETGDPEMTTRRIQQFHVMKFECCINVILC